MIDELYYNINIKLVQAGIKLNKDYWAKTYGLKDEEFEVVNT